jgi:hypothetical protein
VVEKDKPKRPSTSKGGPQHQNHVKMNTYILDAMVMERWNDKKVASHVHAKASANGIS